MYDIHHRTIQPPDPTVRKTGLHPKVSTSPRTTLQNRVHNTTRKDCRTISLPCKYRRNQDPRIRRRHPPNTHTPRPLGKPPRSRNRRPNDSRHQRTRAAWGSWPTGGRSRFRNRTMHTLWFVWTGFGRGVGRAVNG